MDKPQIKGFNEGAHSGLPKIEYKGKKIFESNIGLICS